MNQPVCMLLHPVGIGATRAMNVLSAKLWLKALVDLLPDVVIDRAESCHGAVSTGGEFSRGMITEWDLFGRLKRPQIDLTRAPLPGLLTYETFSETRTTSFQKAVTEAFRPLLMRAAA